jgi:hypothetical protein
VCAAARRGAHTLTHTYTRNMHACSAPTRQQHRIFAWPVLPFAIYPA